MVVFLAGTVKDRNESEKEEIGARTAGVASLMVFGRFIAMILSGIAFIIVARLLGPSVYGIYTLAIAFAGFFGLGFGDLGVSVAFSKFIGQYSMKTEKDEIERVISSGYAAVTISGLVFTLVVFLLSGFVSAHILSNASLTYVMQIVSFSIITAMLYAISYYALVGFGKGAYVAIVLILQAFFQAVASIVLAFMGLGAIAPILGIILGYIVVIITTLALLRFKLGIRLRKPSLTHMRKLLKFSSPISIYNGLRGFISNLSPIVLGIFATTAIVGNFGVALRAGSIISTFTETLGLAVLPMFAYTVYSKSMNKNIGKFFNRVVHATYLLVTPMLLYITILSKQVSFTVFSAVYTYAPLYISVISAGIFLWIVATYTNMLIVGSNKVKELLIYSIVICCIEIVSLFTLAPIFGGLGVVALMFIITPFLISAFLLGVANRELKIRLEITRLIRIIIAGLISAVPLVLLIILSNNYIMILILGAVSQIILYPIIIALTRAADRKDFEGLANVTRKIPLLGRSIKLLVDYSTHFLR